MEYIVDLPEGFADHSVFNRWEAFGVCWSDSMAFIHKSVYETIMEYAQFNWPVWCWNFFWGSKYEMEQATHSYLEILADFKNHYMKINSLGYIYIERIILNNLI